MGRIKSTLVKRTSRKLIENDSFSGSFENNKRVLGSNTMPSKRIRNMIAGYISRLKKVQARDVHVRKINCTL